MRGFFRWANKWWPGLIPLAVLWGVAAWTSTAPLENDLAARAGAALKDSVLDKTRLSVAGRDVTLAADAFSEEGRQDALARVGGVAGVRLVNDETRLVPEARPFVWTPSATSPDDARRQCAAAGEKKDCSRPRELALGGVEVADQMNLARGAPARSTHAALLLIDQIGKLKDGKITLTDTSVRLSGMARDLGGREAIAAALKNLPEGFTVAANDVKAPPYIFQAYKDPVAVTLTLTGYVPDNNVHAALVTAAAPQILQREGRRQSQGQCRSACRICRRGDTGAGGAVAAVDRHAGGVGPGGQAVGRCAL